MTPRKGIDFRYNKLPYWMTFTRASSAWDFVNGILVEFTSNKPRIIQGSGLRYEESRTNLVTDCRDLSGWSATDITTGSGVNLSNTSSTIQVHAEEDNGKIWFEAASSNNCYTLSTYIKSLSANVGTIEISSDNVTWYKCDVVSYEYRRFQLTVLTENPTIYFRLSTAGDEFLIDCTQIEVGAYATTPIITSGGTVTRNADILYTDYFDFTGGTWEWLGGTSGTFNIQCELYKYDKKNTFIDLFYYLDPSPPSDYFTLTSVNGSGHQIGINFGSEYLTDFYDISTNLNLAVSYNQVSQTVAMNGINTYTTPNTSTFDLSVDNRMYLGQAHDGTQHINGWIQAFWYFTETATPDQLNAITNTKTDYTNYNYAELLTDEFAIWVNNQGGTFEGGSCLQTYLDTYADYVATSQLFVTPNGYDASKIFTLNETHLSFQRTTKATRFNSSHLIAEENNNIPRINYPLVGCGKWLFEPQRTNLITYSNDFGNAVWLKADTYTTPSSDLFIGQNDIIFKDTFARTGLLGSAVSYSTQVIIKKVDHRYAFIQFAPSSGASPYMWFDFDTETTQINNCTVNVTALTDGYYNINMNFTGGGTNHVLYVYLVNSMGSFINNSAKSLQIAYIGAEQATYATTPIITAGSTATRNADDVKLLNSGYFGSEGTIFIDLDYQNDAYHVYLVDGSNIIIVYTDSGNLYFTGSNGSTQWNISGVISTGNHKIGAAYKANDIVLYLDGVQVGTDTSAAIPVPDDIYINQDYAGNYNEANEYRAIEITNTRYTNTQLIAMTS